MPPSNICIREDAGVSSLKSSSIAEVKNGTTRNQTTTLRGKYDTTALISEEGI